MNIDRRAFIGVAASLTAISALPSCASVAVLPVVPVDGTIRLDLTRHPRLLAPGGSLRMRLPDSTDQIYVLALENGEFAAVSPICTHLGCTVDVAGPRLVCPCHGSTYARDGSVLRGPAERPLRRYPVRETSTGGLVIDLEAST